MSELKAGKYNAYPEYKDSGVEWLEDVPKHWGSKPLKYLCSFNDDVLPDNTNKDFELCYVDIGSVSATEGLTRTETMSYDKAPSRARRLVQDGDVIVSTVRTYLEAIAPINNPPSNMVVSTGFAVIRPNIKLYKGYAAYCLRASGFIKEVVARSVGVSYPAINASDLVSISVPSLPMGEQTQIANFLDHETAKIDTLIEKQQQLIKLLKEKRQAVISHAVTKGLNAKASIKDSGVEWLGEVPDHWEVIQFRRFTKLSQGLQIPQSERFYELGKNRAEYITIKSINAGVDSDLKEYIESKNQRVFCSKEEILLARTGATGEVITGVEGVYHNNFFKVSFDKSYISKDYLFNLLKVKELKSHLLMLAGTTTIPDLNHGAFLSTKVALPPKEEQQVIVNEIIHNIGIYDAGITLAETGIKLLQERRTALISAAVTGKIDV